jgi:predicted Zn-dependent protease
MSNFAVQKSYEDTQRRTAANAAEVIAKMNKPQAERAQPEPEGHDDDDGGEGSVDQKVERLMQSRNISRDAAISVLHRLEKRARGFTF